MAKKDDFRQPPNTEQDRAFNQERKDRMIDQHYSPRPIPDPPPKPPTPEKKP